MLGQDKRYSYYGRTVGLAGSEDGDIDHLAALAIVQGNAVYGAVPVNQVDAIKASLAARGLVPMHYDKWEGSGSAIAAARHVVATHSLPEDLTMLRLDASSPDGHLASLAEMALGCGVLPLCGEALRGLLRPPSVWWPLTAPRKWSPAPRPRPSPIKITPNMAAKRGGVCSPPTLRGVVNGCRWFLGHMPCLRWKHASDSAIS